MTDDLATLLAKAGPEPIRSRGQRASRRRPVPVREVQQMTTTDKPSIAELQRQTGEPDPESYCLRCHEQMSVPVELEPSALCDRCAQRFVADAAPVLLEIVAAALAMREQERRAERATTAAAVAPLAQINPDWEAAGVENDKLKQCQIAYDVALAKVRP